MKASTTSRRRCYTFSLFLLPLWKAALLLAVTRNSNEKKGNDGKEHGQTGGWKDWNEEVMIDGVSVSAHMPEECKGNDGSRCWSSARAHSPSCHHLQSIDNVT